MGNDSPSLGARTQFVDVDGRRLAYRTFGSGTPLVLCVRFRGTMDTWDPLFLDSLVEQGFQVTIFDYSGLGSRPASGPIILRRSPRTRST